MVYQFMKGLEVNQDSLAVEVIDQVGPGGNYLQHPSTLKRFKEIYYSKLFDRSMAFKKDAPKFGERLRNLTLKYMAHESAQLPKEVVSELDKLEASWRKGK
jgi:trimethylamine--corrinoid protein Co-methyltransferase